MPANNSVRGPAAIVIGILVLVLTYSSIFTINERELAVVLEFGKHVRSIEEPGLYFKIPLIQEVRRLPKTRQFWASGSGDILEALPTKDGKKIEISVWAIWQITNPKQFVKEMRTVQNAEQQVLQRVRAGVRDVVTAYDLSEVVRSTDRKLTNTFGLADIPLLSTEDESIDDLTQIKHATVVMGREKIMAEIRDRIEAQLAVGSAEDGGPTIDRGIKLVDVGVSNIGFTESVRRAAFERLQAFMDAIAARYENEGEQRKQEIINEVNAEVEKILGEGEEQSKRLRGEAEAEIIELFAKAIRETGDFYNFQRTLQVYENAFGDETRLILTTDSELLQMLKGIGNSGSGPITDAAPKSAE